MQGASPDSFFASWLTSSVTAAASAWDGMHPGANTLDTAAIVKMTRTLAIIPITLVLAFLATSLYFGLMAVYGTTTHKDLSGWGPKLMMALFALLITGFVGLLFGMGFMGTVLYSGIGLVVFMLLTAYDTQKLSQMYSYYAGDSELAEKASIYGALTLYLDFINIFLYVVRLLGLNSRRRD